MADQSADAEIQRGRGRPTDYDPAMCERVIECGKQGMSRAEIASALDCSRTTLAAWEKAHPDFLHALRRAKDEALAWWERQSRANLANKNFNAPLWAKSMSGRFPEEPYRERVQLTGKDDGPIQKAHAFDLTDATDEELDVIERFIRRRAADAGGNPGGEGEAES